MPLVNFKRAQQRNNSVAYGVCMPDTKSPLSNRIAGHSSRAVLGMYCFRSLGYQDRGMDVWYVLCVYSVCIVLCLGRGLATS
jgi:hypothetical protein